MMAAISDLS